jgi:hypothetical protein
MLAQRVPVRVVMRTLGHSQISLTLNTCSRIMPAMQYDAADLVGALLTAEARPNGPRRMLLRRLGRVGAEPRVTSSLVHFGSTLPCGMSGAGSGDARTPFNAD